MKQKSKIKKHSLNQYPLSSEEINLLAELGFMSAISGYVVPAIRIFQGLLVLRPDHSFPYVGLAIARMHVGAFDDAIRVLREAKELTTNNIHEIDMYLGLALHLAKQNGEAGRVLTNMLEQEVLDSSQRPLAEAVIAKISGGKKNQVWPVPARIVNIN